MSIQKRDGVFVVNLGELGVLNPRTKISFAVDSHGSLGTPELVLVEDGVQRIFMDSLLHINGRTLARNHLLDFQRKTLLELIRVLSEFAQKIELGHELWQHLPESEREAVKAFLNMLTRSEQSVS